MNEVTCWYKWNFRDRVEKFNHISDWWDDNQSEPPAVSQRQRECWGGISWSKRRAELVRHVVTNERLSVTVAGSRNA